MKFSKAFKLAGLAVILFLFAATGLVALDRFFPPVVGRGSVATVVLAADKTLLRAFADDSGVWRYPVQAKDVSSLYLEALLAYEDRWFYFHPGVNPFAMVRAFFQNFSQGRVVSGGSTLTMQVARILYPDHLTRAKNLYTWQRLANKFRQILRAVQLEIHLSKDEILELYLVHAPFGSNIEGVWAAAQTWLGKDAGELTHAEAALLAVLPQAPSFYRPDRHAKRAQKARDKVLDRLDVFGVWSHEQIVAAKQEPVTGFRFQPPIRAPLAARRLHFQAPKDQLIQSCLDFDLQVHVEEILESYIASFPQYQSAAVMVVNHRTLETVVYAGSADFTSQKRKGHVDMIQALRSPGSALKPFVYGLAMDEGLIHSHSLLLDTPRFGREYMPQNFSSGFTGPVTVAKALAMSLNIPAVQVLEALGPQKFHDCLKNGGARLRLAGRPNLSMILGGMGTDLESLVTVYSALARNGLAGRPRLRKDDPVQERYLMSPGAAYIILQLLSRPLPGQENVSRLSGNIPMAWKTGTSYGFRDAWALGIMGDYVAGVWVGRPDGSPSYGQYGAVTAIPLLGRVFESLPLSGSKEIVMPDTVEKKIICWPTGISEQRSRGACQVRHKAWILDHQIPSTMTRGLLGNDFLVQTFWVNGAGKRATPACGGIKKVSIALWPRSAEPWLPAAWRRNRLIPPMSDCPGLAPLPANCVKIISVSDNSILTLEPGQAKPPMIPLQVLGKEGRLHWFLNRVPLRGENPLGFLLPDPGTYELAVVDENGTSDRVCFKVIKALGNHGED